MQCGRRCIYATKLQTALSVVRVFCSCNRQSTYDTKTDWTVLVHQPRYITMTHIWMTIMMHDLVVDSHLCQPAQAIYGQTADAFILLSCCAHCITCGSWSAGSLTSSQKAQQALTAGCHCISSLQISSATTSRLALASSCMSSTFSSRHRPSQKVCERSCLKSAVLAALGHLAACYL